MTLEEVISDLNVTIADLETIQLTTTELIRAIGQLKAARGALVRTEMRLAAVEAGQRRLDGPR